MDPADEEAMLLETNPEVQEPTVEKKKSSSRLPFVIIFGMFLLNLLTGYNTKQKDVKLDFDDLASKGAICPAQPEPLFPRISIDFPSNYRNTSAHLLSQAVQIPTQSFDDNGSPTEDSRWGPFFDFKDWLVSTFPLVHQVGKREMVNTLGIILTFEGSDPSLKPTMLMSHYDVVPAPDNTLDRWTHPPFSGFIDKNSVWGRGAADDKTLLVGQCEFYKSSHLANAELT